MKAISRKTRYVRTDGLRGYVEPVNAVCGANDTGTWDDSPCPTGVRIEELSRAKKVLRENRIKYTEMMCQSSNVFTVHVYILTHEEDQERARELIKPLVDEARLLYLVDRKEDTK